MHANGALLERLFSSLNRHDHEAMAACYHSDATFEDIAFHLKGQKRVHAMWHMICDTDIKATFEVVQADGQHGHVKLVDSYTFQETGRPVENSIDSHFIFRDGSIFRHEDVCDPREWADSAMGPILGFLPGRSRLMRSALAACKLWRFTHRHPEYR